MKIVIWIVQGLLALAFLGSGFLKLTTPYADLAASPGMEWANDFSATQIKIIAILEILGAIGVIVPMFVKRFQLLVPIAAIGLALVMVGAAITHISRGESFVPNIVLFVLAALTAWWRRHLLRGQGA